MKKLFAISWLWLGALAALGQVPAEATHPIPTKKIAWSDFVGSIDPSSPYWARTEWRVSYTYKMTSFRQDTVQLDVQVQALLKNTSWVLPARQTDELLTHEQGHFDCALVVAALFKKAVATTVFTKGSYAQQLRELFASALAQGKQLEAEYDLETNHMRNVKAQLAWSKKLEELLEAAH